MIVSEPSWTGRKILASTGAACAGQATQNGSVESLWRMRDELLSESLFFSLDHARQNVAVWALDDNTRRRSHRPAV